MSRRLLIVNADDLGQTPGINRGIRRAHEHGIVTSASLMVRWAAAAEAARVANANPSLSVGLHVDLGEWVYDGDEWRPLYEVVDTENRDEVAREVASQLRRFRELLGRDPTHIDSHQHVHRQEPVRGVVAAMGADLGVPVRQLDPRVAYSGAFYGKTGKGDPFHEAITEESLIKVIQALPEGVTEMGCHPGEDDGSEMVYREERWHELHALCSATVVSAVREAGVRLISFHDVPE